MLYALLHFESSNFVNLDMDAFLTNQQKLDFARCEFLKVKDTDESITWENSRMLQYHTPNKIFDLFVLGSILKKIFGNLSETKLNDLLYDADKDCEFNVSTVCLDARINYYHLGTGKILLDDFIQLVNYLVLNEKQPKTTIDVAIPVCT